MEQQNILIIGLGGIGSALAEALCRYIAYSGNSPNIVLIDGDRYESINRFRQRISHEDIGLNKAAVWTAKLARLFPELKLSAREEFIRPENIRSIIADNSIIILCVDNHASRKLIQDHLNKLRNVTLISGGNDYTDGNVQVFIRKNGRTMSPSITAYHQEIAFPQDKRPDELGCEEELKQKPQLLFTNMTAAVLMLNAFYALTQNKLQGCEVYFDILKNSAKSVRRFLPN